MTTSLIERCLPAAGAGNVATTVLAEITPATSAGDFSQSSGFPADTKIDTQRCSYSLRTRFSSPGNGTFCVGTTLRMQKARIQWIP